MGTRACGAHSAAAAIWAAYLAVVKLQAAAAARLRAFLGLDCDGLEPPRLARAALARHSLANPHILRRLQISFLSGRPAESESAREGCRQAGAALPVPQGGARDVGQRPHVRRCAASAARVCRCLCAAERVLLRASQDRSRDDFRVWAWSWVLPRSRAHDSHRNVGLVARGVRSEERGRDARAMRVSVGSPHRYGTSDSITRVSCESVRVLHASTMH